MKFIDGVVVERVGDDVVVLTPEGRAIKLSGGVADSARRLLDDPSSLTDADTALLLDTGVVEENQPSGLSRRAVVTGGVVGASAGILSLSLPAAAQSLSPGASNTPGTTSSGSNAGGDAVTIEADVWGSYFASEITYTANSLQVVSDFVSVVVLVGPQRYANRIGLGFFDESAGWPEDVDPDDSWDLVFTGGAAPLTVFLDPERGSMTFFSYKIPNPEDDDAQDWLQELFDFLADKWAAEQVVQVSITNGSLVIPVNLYPETADDD